MAEATLATCQPSSSAFQCSATPNSQTLPSWTASVAEAPLRFVISSLQWSAGLEGEFAAWKDRLAAADALRKERDAARTAEMKARVEADPADEEAKAYIDRERKLRMLASVIGAGRRRNEPRGGWKLRPREARTNSLDNLEDMLNPSRMTGARGREAGPESPLGL